MHASQSLLSFSAAGRLKTVTDRNTNLTTFGYDPYGNHSFVLSSRGGPWTTSGPTAKITLTGGKVTGGTQASGSLTRTATIGYDSG